MNPLDRQTIPTATGFSVILSEFPSPGAVLLAVELLPLYNRPVGAEDLSTAFLASWSSGSHG
jgi:hypothetical protein